MQFPSLSLLVAETGLASSPLLAQRIASEHPRSTRPVGDLFEPCVGWERVYQRSATLYARDASGVELSNMVCALDASTFDLCLPVFPWGPFFRTKAAIKLRTLLDLRGNTPTFLHLSDQELHDVHVLGLLLPEPRAFYVMDLGCFDVGQLHRLHAAGSFFVTRDKCNLNAQPVIRIRAIEAQGCCAIRPSYSPV